jgi:alanine dehydrogenase
MIIGVPKEIKAAENRVALQPSGTEILVADGHTVLMEKDAGAGSGFNNDEYINAGAKIVNSPAQIFKPADMIIKVKEPLDPEYPLMRPGQIMFTYFHFASSKYLTKSVLKTKSIAIAYETMLDENNQLPLLVPMSEVAGRMATQEGAKYLEKIMGGRGVLLGGVPGVEPADVVILGGGIVGTNAAKVAAGMGANVTILDVNLKRLRELDDIMPKNVTMIASNPENIRKYLSRADLLIGAVLIAGAKAPKLVTKDMLKLMKPGAVIVDVAVDQGGCIETIKPTTHGDPVYTVDGIIHYGVANMPGAVPFTSTKALTNATFPFARKLAAMGWKEAAKVSKEIRTGINMVDGKVTCLAVAQAFNLKYSPIENFLN